MTRRSRVEGHTDNIGKPDYNEKPSQRRAAAVLKWLVDHGIDKTRLVSAGYDHKQPIDSNETDAGRANNRRVAFSILQREQKPADKPTP